MRLGIFAKAFARPNLEQTLDAVVAHRLKCIHFNFASAGLPSLPERIDGGLAEWVGKAARTRGLEIAGVSATFNLIDPDHNKREKGFGALEAIAGACRGIGTRFITLCTGTRDPNDMWRAHPDNESPEAWTDLRIGIHRALDLADQHDLRLGIEPELGNVINSAPKARRLLDEMRSPRLKIIIDGANLLRPSDISRASAIWNEAFQLLEKEIVVAHAKDLKRDGTFCAAGSGDLDWPLYIGLLQKMHFTGPLILHGLAESEVAGSVAYLEATLQRPQSIQSAKGVV